MTPQIEIPDPALAARQQVIERALDEAVRDALLRHKKLGQSIAIWRDGHVVRVPAEQISVEVAERASA